MHLCEIYAIAMDEGWKRVSYWMGWPVRCFIRWYLSGKIRYMERMIENSFDNADVWRDGHSPDYWQGKRDGIRVSMVQLLEWKNGEWS